MAKYVVDLDQSLSPTDVEEGMRIGVEKKKYKIVLPLPPKIEFQADPKMESRSIDAWPVALGKEDLLQKEEWKKSKN